MTHMRSRPTSEDSTPEQAPLSSEYRQIFEEYQKFARYYREVVEFRAQVLEAGDKSNDAPRFPAPRGADVFLALEVERANRLLEQGPRTYAYVCIVADRLAAAIVARTFGVETTARVLRAGKYLSKTATLPAPLPLPPGSSEAFA